MKNQWHSLLFAVLACTLPPAQAQTDDFVVQDIRVEGLQRISAGTVFNYLPVGIGATVGSDDYAEIIRALFQTGFFTDINLERDNGVLVITVVERPAIAEINITGNQDIPTDALLEALKNIGLAEGEVFNRSLLEKLEQELLNQYFSRGKYAVQINTDVKPLPRNRVAISLDISEGVAARIRQINIVGNDDFDDEDLLDEFQLSGPGYLTFLTKGDQYSKQKLAADIEALRSFYLDRGYLKFDVTSTQVSITPDKKDIYITINITEGEPYTISAVRLAGDLVVPQTELEPLIATEPGATFSRKTLNDISQQIADRLGDEGYAFANVNTVPSIDEENKSVDLTFVVDPGRRVYVRRINFVGNEKTQDDVLRREMRQAEGGWFSTKDINRSKTRLERLRYLEQVTVETPPVPGTTDQVDVNVNVIERPSGNFIFGVGYGQNEGILLNTSVTQSNFLGTGNEVSFAFNNSQSDTIYSVSYTNPYFTPDGVSRGFRLAYQETDAEENNTADYTTNEYLGQVNFGFPLNEFDTLQLAFNVEGTDISTTSNTPQEILDELEQNGDSYLDFKVETSFARDSRNRLIFPDTGALNRVSVEITTPGSDAEYYKIGYRHQSYIPLLNFLTLSLRANIGYGDGYGDTDGLPFFEKYYAGGLSTVRGFEANSLGPRYSDGDPRGGDLRLIGGAELIFPVPFLKDSQAFRLAAFVDAGNVFDSPGDFDAGELRYSTGIAARWLSPFGPLAISVAAPLNDEADDDTESVQFSFGVPF